VLGALVAELLQLALDPVARTAASR
jgi:hypothetical protein